MANADGVMVVAPRELIVPTVTKASTEQPDISGALFLSGAKLYFSLGATKVLITSA